MQDLPRYISLVFALTTFLTVALFYRTILRSRQAALAKVVLGAMLLMLALHGILAYNGFYYSRLEQMPPRLMVFGALPAVLVMIILFNSKKGRTFIDDLSFTDLTMISIVRIPVEICLYWLALHKTVPELMSFAGRNFDILAGLTAPLVVYFGITKNGLNRSLLWIWNIIGILLLLNIIIHAILSAPFPLQQLAFDQPNLAILYFPFIWLAVFVAPLVLLTHFISIRKLIRNT